MASKSIPLTAVSIQSTSPNKAFGEVALPPIGTVTGNTSRLLLRGPISLIPSTAVISNAKLQVWMKSAWAGSRTVVAQALTSSWSTKSVWGSVAGTPPARPTSTATNQASVTQSGVAADGLWEFDVTAIAQQWLSGALVNNGLHLTSTSTTAGIFRGAAASKLNPVLVVTYLVAGDAPTGLSPAGVVGITKPVLRAQFPGDAIDSQWQIDPTGVFTSPTFDSGSTGSGAGYFDLAGSAYGGLSSGSTQWRTRYKTALGWQPWSSPATFSFVGYGSFAFSSPGTTTEDPSSPIAGTATPEAGATVTGWRIATLDVSGSIIEDSGNRTGAIAYGPTKSYVTARVDFMTSTVREATPGDPGYVRTTRTPTVAQSAVPSPFTSPAATSDGSSAAVALSAARAAGTPDEVAVYRRAPSDTSMGVLVVRGPGTTYAPSGNLATQDWTAAMNTDWVYDFYAIVNGQWSAKASTATLKPTCKGIWFYYPVDGSSVFVAGTGDIAEVRTDLATVFQPVNGVPFVRRVANGLKSGSFSDLVFLDALGRSGAAQAATWLTWSTQGVSEKYRMIVGNRNLEVNLWNLDTTQRPENTRDQFVENAVGSWLATGG